MKMLAMTSVAAAVLLAGCTVNGSGPSDVVSGPSPQATFTGTDIEPFAVDATAEGAGIVAASKSSASAPATFRERSPLADCGTQIMTSVTRSSPRDFDCLVAADRLPGAELTVVRRTQEGDPIVTYYRVSPKIDGIEVFSDNTLDSFRSKDWTHHRYTLDELTEFGI